MKTILPAFAFRSSVAALFALFITSTASRVCADDTEPPVITFAPLVDGNTVSDLAQLGGTVTDDADPAPVVVFSIHEYGPNGGNGRYWNGLAWQANAIDLPGTVTGTTWQKNPAGTLPALNSGLRYVLTVTASDAAGHVSAPASITVRTAIQSLTWDPGITHLGTEILHQPHRLGGSHVFKIITQNTAVGAWRTALNVTAGEADVYLSQGAVPNVSSHSFGSARVGSDGFVVASAQFAENQEWFFLVESQPGATWNLVSGEAYVQDLGAMPDAKAVGDTAATIGAEGWRYFRTVAPADTRAWRLWLHEFDSVLHVRKGFAPLPENADLKQANAMLVVPDYLQADTTYLVGVPGDPGTAFTFHSKQQPVTALDFNSTQKGVNVTGFPYTTYRVEVPIRQIAWEVRTAPTSGNPDLAIRRGFVPNEWNNDAFSEVPGAIEDSVTLVPPTLSDGTFYITTYGSAPRTFDLRNGEPVITPRGYVATTANDAPNRAGWRYYVVDDIPGQLGTLGWDFVLADQQPGTEIALRRNAVPCRWRYRLNGSENFAQPYVDFSGVNGFLQRPGHQADIWYVGIYQPNTSLGAFTLTTSALAPTPVSFDGSTTTIAHQAPGRWQFFRVDVPEDALGWDVRLVNVSSGQPNLVIRRDLLPEGFNGGFAPNSTDWPTGTQWSAGYDWTGFYFNANGSINTGRLLEMGRDNPLKPGTYYVGVRDDQSVTPASYQFVSRGLGAGFALPVADLDFSGPGGKAVNNAGLAPREAAYYRVTIPPNQPSWKIRLTPTAGEAVLVVNRGTVPSVATGGYNAFDGGGRRLAKGGRQQFLLLPRDGEEFVQAGAYYLCVASEGVAPVDGNTIGTGLTTYVLESLGSAPSTTVGSGTVLPVGAAALTQSVAVAGGEVKLLQFTLPAGVPALEVRLRNRTGNPSVTVRGGTSPAWPHVPIITGEIYGADGGGFAGRYEGTELITVANPLPGTFTVTVKAEEVSALYPDATADLTVQAVAPTALAFDGGNATVTGQEPGAWRFYTVTVPTDTLGWDLRITDVIGNSTPQLYIRREALPDLLQSSFVLQAQTWEPGQQFNAGYDWTLIYNNADGSIEYDRLFAAGLGSPLVPGVYQVGVYNSATDFPAAYTLHSRGIGDGRAIAVHDLAFTGGNVTVPSLAPREAAYFRVVVPPNTPGWKLRLAPASGEAMMLVRAGSLPNVDIRYYNGERTGSGVRMQKAGNEQYSVFPTEGQDYVAEGVNYIAVVSEGEGGQSGSTVGLNPTAFRLESFGVPAVTDLGAVPAVGAGRLAAAVALEGGEVKVIRFRLEKTVPSLEVRLDNRVGNPFLALRPGRHEPYAYQATLGEYYGTEGGWVSLRQEAGGFDPVTQITLANPPVGDYRLTIRAGYDSQAKYADAGGDLTIRAVGPAPLAFDGSNANLAGHTPGTWRFFTVEVPPDALGWDLRLNGITGGNAQLYVRREVLPDFNAPRLFLYNNDWLSGEQHYPDSDFTRLNDPDPVTGYYTGHTIVLGRGGPLVAGTYSVGVYVDAFEPAAASYTLTSRGIGGSYSIPVTPLAFAGGSASSPGLAPREIAWYAVEVPSGAASWRVKLDASLGGEALLVVRKGRLPNVASFSPDNRTDLEGRLMSKDGNEHFLLLPEEGQPSLTGGTYYIGVVSTGVGPANGFIGTGTSPFTLLSVGAAPVKQLGVVPAVGGRLTHDVTLEGGETKPFQFEMPAAVEWAEVRLANRLGAPALALRPGDEFPNPNVPARPFGYGYGNDGGYYSQRTADPFLLTLVRPEAGTWSFTVKAEFGNANDQPDATAEIQIEQRTPAQLTFMNGSVSATLADNQRAFYRVEVPTGVLGWKLDLDIANGSPTVRARKGVLPSDADPGFVAFGGPSIVIAPPVLQPGTWFVEVKGGGVSEFTLHSGPVELVRPAWAMPAFGSPVTTPGLPTGGIVFADTGVDAAGVALPGDQGIDLGNGDFHYYAFTVPPGNGGLLRGELLAISGNPDAYVRAGDVPTLSHGDFGYGQLADFTLVGTGSEYGNWVPLDGKTETQLAPGPWYVAVRANTSNVRYRLRLSVGSVTALSPGVTLANQSIAAGDWRYYRVAIPADAPQTATIIWSAQQGDADLYIRDTLPPGEPYVSFYGYRDWGYDRKNAGPYPVFTDQGTYALGVPPLRPGSVYYLGFRAQNDATFTVRVNFSAPVIDVPFVVNFYGGERTVTLPPHTRLNFRVPVPADATSWRHRNTHTAAVSVYLDQGTLPDFGAAGRNGYIYGSVNSTDDSLVQFLYGWPWIAGEDYFFTAENTSDAPQPLTIRMDGRRAATDDSDFDGLPDSWELAYFGNLNQNGFGDPDGDGVDNTTEFAEGTNPISAGSLRPRLTALVSGEGRVVKEPELPSYVVGQTVRLFAVPASGSSFSRWEGDGIASTANPLSLTLNASKSITAIFVGGEIPLMASAPTLVGAGNFQTAFTGPAASALIVETSTDLEHWTEVRRVEPFTGSYLFEFTGPLGNLGFFRARLVP